MSLYSQLWPIIAKFLTVYPVLQKCDSIGNAWLTIPRNDTLDITRPTMV